jgi:hypothetical protein
MRNIRRRTTAAVVIGVALLGAACAAPPELAPDQETTSDVGSLRRRTGTNRTTTTTTSTTTTTTTTTTPPSGSTTTFVPVSTETRIAGCEIFPRDHFLNATNVDRLPVHPRSAEWINFLARDNSVLGFPSSKVWDGARGGIPLNVVDSRTVGLSPVLLNHNWTAHNYTGGYPIPSKPKVEGYPSVQWDQHLLMLDVADCNAYELIQYEPRIFTFLGFHTALSGVRYPLNTTVAPRITTNAVGTPMIGQMVMSDEVLRGRLAHVVGFCTDAMNTGHLWPARSSDGLLTSREALPAGAWLRLRPGVDVSRFTGQARTIVEALRRHGTVLTDTCGHRFYLMAENSDRWNDSETQQLRSLTPRDFEVVDTTPMRQSDTSFRIT